MYPKITKLKNFSFFSENGLKHVSICGHPKQCTLAQDEPELVQYRINLGSISALGGGQATSWPRIQHKSELAKQRQTRTCINKYIFTFHLY